MGRSPQQKTKSVHVYYGKTAGWIKTALCMEVGLSPGTQTLSPKRWRSPQFSAHVYCGQTAGWIKMALGMEVGLGSGHIEVDCEPPHLSKKKEQSHSIFGPFLLWSNGWMHQDATWYGDWPQPRRLCVRWGPTPCPKWAEPQFLAHVYCGQTAAWIKMSLGTEIGLGLRDIVLDGDPAPPP